MDLKSSSGKSPKSPSARSAGPKARAGELAAKDLDKVTGGLRATGKKIGDPCDGGE